MSKSTLLIKSAREADTAPPKDNYRISTDAVLAWSGLIESETLITCLASSPTVSLVGNAEYSQLMSNLIGLFVQNSWISGVVLAMCMLRVWMKLSIEGPMQISTAC